MWSSRDTGHGSFFERCDHGSGSFVVQSIFVYGRPFSSMAFGTYPPPYARQPVQPS